ncbi:MAG: sulfate adenylyltransferase subunit CysD [Candidatus Azotimanducaceae bacterium WSBS_2022_MAG_OTU7]
MALTLPDSIYLDPAKKSGERPLWDSHLVRQHLQAQQPRVSIRTAERAITEAKLVPTSLKLEEVRDEHGQALNHLVRDNLQAQAKQQRQPLLVIQQFKNERSYMLMANDGRLGRKWMFIDGNPQPKDLLHFLEALSASYEKPLLIWPHGQLTKTAKKLAKESNQHTINLANGGSATLALTAYHQQPLVLETVIAKKKVEDNMEMTHLDRLEAESIHIIREVMAESENPVMMYSIGKDSSVMLRLAEKAFYPSKPPFPLLHVDTRWKFQAMYEFRDKITEQTGMDLIVHINPEGIEKNINPFDHGSSLHTDIMKTQGLLQALDKYGFDAAFGGARRDEEKSRAKERVFSFRNSAHRWDPKTQRPELWNLYNGRKSPGESIRVFPLSNWTELDIWEYLYKEDIPLVPLYFAAERPVVERDGMLMMVDDDRLKLFPGEKIQTKRVRFRTLGCYPLTGAIESDADDLPKILLELLEARTSERQGRAIDKDSSASMEKKKQEGYF